MSVTTKDSQEMATWTGQGIGGFSSPGKISFRGSLFSVQIQKMESYLSK
jgi:hypothetical protein